ncbi:cation-translocating P-type ATPase [Catelliglobosispora koreensis]|uniref:cation-translocating P-type ATPase n=1 Tax=Catelliglobosispora koreensis TaxID=129052 RepID=UPI00035FBA5C|nr:cation-translocating P-type ATPase [Catelliglobosispora koreensis]
METLVRPAPAGLTSAEAAARLAADGPNTVARTKPRRLTARIGAQLTDPLVMLLLAAAVVTLVLRDWTDTAVIALVIVLNTAIGVAQQVRADRAIAALDDYTAPTARVVRDGADQTIAAADVVRGDLIRVEAGDIVPADLLIEDAFRCQADEAALTGESVPVFRSAGEELFSGTVIVTGRATGVAVRTGATSALGRIAHLVASAKSGPTPLQRRLARLGRVLGAAVVALCLLVFGIGVAAGQPVLTMALVAVSLVVAAVPESLPAVVTLALALGARRMARHKAIPRNLHAVETMGSVTVLASDKTGTLTEGRMSVRQAVAAGDGVHDADGIGYTPTGTIDPEATPELLALARAAVLCSDANIVQAADSPDWIAIGDPMEAALVVFAARCGLDPQHIRLSAPRIAEHPFDQATRQMTTISRVRDEYYTVCKGAPETVLVPPVIDDTDPHLQAARNAAQTLAAQGMRVIAVAAGTSIQPGNPSAPQGLRIQGVIGVADPLRTAAAKTAASFERAGIRLLLITGDHPATASVIAAQVGIWHPGEPIGTGDRPELAHEVHVFARTQPEQKLGIIAALQDRGHVVAMTGDGVNDAPALRQADIGVAMGSGTEVARQAADLVLLDDNLGTVTAAVGEGRRVYDNIRRFLRYGLSGGLAEILVMLLGPALGMAVPLLPGQILWVNLLTHGVTGVAIGAEPAEPDVLHRPPRPPGEQVLGAGLWRGVLLLGTLLTAVTLGTGVFAMRADWPWQSMVFVTLGLTQLGLAMAVRVRGSGLRNPGLLAAVAFSAAAQIAAVLIGPLRDLLGTEPLSWAQLGFCAVAALLPAAGLWLWKHWRG